VWHQRSAHTNIQSWRKDKEKLLVYNFLSEKHSVDQKWDIKKQWKKESYVCATELYVGILSLQVIQLYFLIIFHFERSAYHWIKMVTSVINGVKSDSPVWLYVLTHQIKQ
jgi:hypothetical protein